MQLNSNDLFLLRQCAISAAFQAGQIICQYNNLPVKVQKKDGGNSLASQVVTEVDHLCEAIILDTLQPTCDIFDLALLTEESPDNQERLNKDYFWCIDPMDGTLSFIQSSNGYAVSIALVSRNGTPYIGVIYDPVEKTLYYAIKDCGAFRNGTAFKVKPSNSQRLTLVADQSFKQSPYYSILIPEIKKIATELEYDDLSLLMGGGAVMNASWVLENNPACYFKLPKPKAGGGSLWDFAATACFFKEAGGVVSDIGGEPLDLNRSDSTFMNHKGVLYCSGSVLAGRIVEWYDSFKF